MSGASYPGIRWRAAHVRAVRYDPVMCLICIEFDRSAMTTREARRALGEMRESLGPDHVEELEAKLAAADEVSEDDSSGAP